MTVANGHYTGCLRRPDGGFVFWGGGPVEIAIFIDLVGWTKEQIGKKSLRAGEAQIWFKDSLIARKPIDLNKTVKEYCNVFGVPYQKIY